MLKFSTYDHLRTKRRLANQNLVLYQAAHKRKQFHNFSHKMVQAQLLKFFKKMTTEGMLFPWLEFKESPDIMYVTVRDWETIGELTLSNFEKKNPKKNLESKKHSLRDEAH